MRPALLWVALLGLGFPAGAADPPEPREELRYVMGTLATVRTWADNPAMAASALDAAFASFDRVDSLMSTWRDDSALSVLNRAPAGMWVLVGDGGMPGLDERDRSGPGERRGFRSYGTAPCRIVGFP